MASSLILRETPPANEVYMIAGWRQWADGGSLSSGLPHYLIEKLGARRIGRFGDNGYYLFQTPVSQFLFRPRIKFEDGYSQGMREPRTDIYWWDDGEKGVLILVGDEPNMNAPRYARAFFDLTERFKVKRTVGLGGVYAIVPYDKERAFSSAYSHPHMKQELAEYSVSFSNYDGGVSIGSYLTHIAEKRGFEFFTLYGFVPMYDFSQVHPKAQPIQIEEDYKGWHDVMLRINHMFKLNVNLTELSEKAAEQRTEVAEAIDQLASKFPQAPIKEYIAKLTSEFNELSFAKLDDMWQNALDDLGSDSE